MLKIGALSLATAVSSISIIPRSVHAEVPRRQTTAPHPYWDCLLDHASRNIARTAPNSGRVWLENWIAATVHEPEKRIDGLMLVGPACSGKSMLHHAIGTLLAPNEYVVSSSFHRVAGEAKSGKCVLGVWDGADGLPNRFPLLLSMNAKVVPSKHYFTESAVNILKPQRFHYIECRDDAPECRNYVATNDSSQLLRRLTLESLKRPISSDELIRRLEDEQENFVRRLARYDLKLLSV